MNKAITLVIYRMLESKGVTFTSVALRKRPESRDRKTGFARLDGPCQFLPHGIAARACGGAPFLRPVAA